MAHEDVQDVAIATITITYSIQADGQDVVEVEAKDEQGDLPALITLLGMMDLARDSLYKMAMGIDDDDEDEDEYDDEDAD